MIDFKIDPEFLKTKETFVCSHSWTPPPLIKGEGVGPFKIESLGRVQKFLPERGDKPEKGGGGLM